MVTSAKAEKLTVCTRYSPKGASSRVRYFAYDRVFRQYGWEPDFRCLLGDRYLEALYQHRSTALSGICGLIRRLAEMPFYSRHLLIEYELLPFFSANLENFLRGKQRKYILNFDDNVWEKYRNRKNLANKFDILIENASGVIAANNELFNRLSRLNRRIVKIPSAVDLSEYPVSAEKFDRFTVAWIGTNVTYEQCLMPFAGILAEVSKQIDFKLLVIADSKLPPLPGVNCRMTDWSAAAEKELLCHCHAGIMPLPDTEFMRGKSAYKLIQYLASGIPAAASPVGENKILADSAPGAVYLAGTADDWAEALKKIRNSPDSAAARDAAWNWSLEKYAPVMGDFINYCFQKEC